MPITKSRLAKAVLLASFSIAAIVLTRAYFGPSTERSYKIDASTSVFSLQQSSVSAASNKLPSEIKPDLALSDASSENIERYQVLSQAELEELKDWSDARGHFDEWRKQDYEAYSDAILTELGKKGDLVALNLLTDRAVKRGDTAAATFLMNFAVIHGSTTELDNLTIYTRPNPPNDATEELRRPAALETLAVTKVIALRGDKLLSGASERSFVDSYRRLYGIELTITPEEQEIVDQRAQEIYDGYQSLRHRKGLGDFDNSEPSSLKKLLGFK